MTRTGWLISAMVLLSYPGAAAAQTVTLDDVLASVERNYPPLLAALAERDIADAELLQAQGAFDLNLGAQFNTDRLGYYPNERVSVGFDQAFSKWGSSAYGGWREGSGAFAPYDGKLDTRSLGEWSGGIKVPLLRNREIDGRRAGVRKADIGRRLAGLSIDQQRLLIRQLAVRRYWDWVGAGQRLRIARDVLRVAEERDEQLKEAARLGQIPAIEVTENRRQILQRQSQLIEAGRGVQQTAFELSLYYRDAAGNPSRPGNSQLPAALPLTEALSDEKMAADLTFALARRPEISRLAAQAEQVEVDIAMARNDRRPMVDASLGFTAEAGSTNTVRRGPQEIKGALTFQLPVQRRAATGKLLAAEAKLGQLGRRVQFARDQVEAEVRDTASAVDTAHRRAELATGEVRVALDLADAERERFRLGDSTLFTVNLREQAAVDAELRAVGAVSDYLRAITLYEQATAQLLR